MKLPKLAEAFFQFIDERIGPFDRPFQFRVFPFDAGGALNFLTIGVGRNEQFVTYVSWDLFGHERQKRGTLGRYELLALCDNEKWCLDILTHIGRQSLEEVFEPGDTLDLGSWVTRDAPLQGVIFEAALKVELGKSRRERCGLLRCIGVTRPELELARASGVTVLIDRLQQAEIYPRTIVQRRTSVTTDR